MNYSWSKVVRDSDCKVFRICSTVLRKGVCTINGHSQHERELQTVLSCGRLELKHTRFPTHVCDNVTRSFEVQYLLPDCVARWFRLAGQFVWIKVESGASM